MIISKNYTYAIYKYISISAFYNHSMMLHFLEENYLYTISTIQLIYQIIKKLIVISIVVYKILQRTILENLTIIISLYKLLPLYYYI